MPVIQMPNPLTAASEAVGGYTAQKNENIDRAEQKRQRDATLALERERLAMEQKQVDESHRHNLTVEGSTKIHDDILVAQEEARKKLEPVMMQIQQLQLQISEANVKNIPIQAEALKLDLATKKLANETTALNNALVKKYGAQTSEIAIKQALATLAQTQQATATSKAEEYRTLHPVAPAGAGIQQEKLQDVRAEEAAEYDVAKGMVDDLWQYGKAGKNPTDSRVKVSQQDLRAIIYADQTRMPRTKLRLLRYISTLKPKPEPPDVAGPDLGHMIQGAAKALTPFWPGVK